MMRNPPTWLLVVAFVAAACLLLAIAFNLI